MQNWYSNISFGRDFSYSVGGVVTTLIIPTKYYDRDDLEGELNASNFIFLFDA